MSRVAESELKLPESTQVHQHTLRVTISTPRINFHGKVKSAPLNNSTPLKQCLTPQFHPPEQLHKQVQSTPPVRNPGFYPPELIMTCRVYCLWASFLLQNINIQGNLPKTHFPSILTNQQSERRGNILISCYLGLKRMSPWLQNLKHQGQLKTERCENLANTT